MKNKLYIIMSFLIIAGLSGCTKLYHMNQPKDYVQEISPVGELAGEWYVVYRYDDGSGVYDDYSGWGTFPLDTYCDSNGDTDSLFISDITDGSKHPFWIYTVKVGCDVEKLTFSKDTAISSAIDNLSDPTAPYLYDIWTNVKSGKIIKDAITLPSGNVVDSIFFEIEFEDAPGFIIQCSGHRRSGFLEDEPQ